MKAGGRQRRAWALAVGLGLAGPGCELVAGVHDVSLTDGGADRDGALTTDAPATTVANPGMDAGVPDAAEPHDETGAIEAGDGGAAIDGSDGAPWPYERIDDMAADNGFIIPGNGRNGFWFAYNDGTGTETPAAGSPILPVSLSPPVVFPAPWGTSSFAMRFTGSGFTKTGGGIGFNFTNPKAPYDASRYAGVTFWGKIGSSADTAGLVVEFPSASTVGSGGICTVCNYNFKTGLVLTTSWAQYTVPFKGAVQSAQAVPHLATLDSNALIGVSFEVTANVTFDVYIADVAFVLP